MSTVLTYYRKISEWEIDHRVVLALWRESWLMGGLQAKVLGPAEAVRHPRYEELMRAVAAFPSVNMREYEDACYERWAAIAWHLSEHGGQAWVCDYDVLNHCWREPDAEGFVTTAQASDNSFICGVSKISVPIAESFVDALIMHPADKVWEHNGKPHVSDQLILKPLSCMADLWTGETSFPGREDFMTAPTVHYCNAFCKQVGASRIELIQKRGLWSAISQ